VTDNQSGFHLKYASARVLQRDYTMRLAKGGMLVAWKSPPAEGVGLLLRIEAPDGTIFDLKGRVAHRAAGSGFIINLDSGATRALDLFMKSDRFKRVLDADKDSSSPPPVTTAIGGADGGAEVGAGDDDAAQDGETLAASEGEMQGATDDPFDPVTAALREANETGSDNGAGADEQGAGDGEDGGYQAADVGHLPQGLAKPGPGDEYTVYCVKFHTVLDFAAMRDEFRRTKQMRVEYVEDPGRQGKVAQLRLILPGHNVYKVFGLIEKVDATGVVVGFDENNEKFRQACLYIDTPAAKGRMKTEETTSARKPPSIARLLEIVPEEDPDKMPIRRRLQRMGMEDKINLALSGDREARMALATDGNKAIHHYLLRNAKISLDEIAFMARLPTMNPDVLDKIAENPQYTQNPSVVKALVYNPKTPVPTAIRLLDRLPRPEVMNLAKRSNMNLRLVMAAKKKLETKRV
jgi:hypothetical protein